MGTSDGASIPALLRGIVSPFGPVWAPAVGHDQMYRFFLWAKSLCDTIFLEMMKACGVDELKAIEFYEAVNLGGGSAFEGDRQKEAGQ